MSTTDETRTGRQCLSDMIEQRYGSRLTPGEMEDLQRAVNVIFEMADALRSVQLENGDGPFALLVPYRKEN